MAESRYQPDPRSYSYSASIDGELYVWGGKVVATTSVQVYDSCLEVWKEVLTHGSTPPGLGIGASAHSEYYLYVYGGIKDDGAFGGCLHRLDTKTSFWTLLAVHSALMKKKGCAMIVYDNSVIIIGGLGTRNGPIQPGSEWLCEDEDEYEDPNTEGLTNEMHKYDLREGTWSFIEPTGTRPPPCSAFSLTMIDNHRAVMFGGVQLGQYIRDAYVLDLTTMHWLKIPHSDESPLGRGGHSAVCLDYGGDRPQLVVTGGVSYDANEDTIVLDDAWIMDVQSGRWKKVPMPSLQPRCGHCAAAFSLSPGITEVVLFGGNTSFSGKADYDIADTKVLRFEKDVNDPQAEWIFAYMADNTLLGTSKRIREKMTKLSQLNHEISRSRQRQLKEAIQANERAQEAEMRCQDLKKKLDERDEQNTSEEARQWSVQSSEIHMTGKILGGGDWGEVYKVQVAKFRGVEVAAKVLCASLQNSYYRNAFIREMNMASRVRHPNLVQFIGASMDEKMVILMELMQTSLLQHIKSNAPSILSSTFRVCISLDVAKALNYLHLMQPYPIIHRDISSANVLLHPLPNQRWRAKLSDYGTVNLQNLLKTENPGNPLYSAPEARIASRQSTKMDIFSYGVLLIEMCTAELPYEARRSVLIRGITEKKWVDMIQECVHQDPRKRLVASQLIARLELWN